MEISWQPKRKTTRLVMFSGTAHQRTTCRFGDLAPLAGARMPQTYTNTGDYISQLCGASVGAAEERCKGSDSRPPSTETSRRNECFKIKAHRKDLCLVAEGD